VTRREDVERRLEERGLPGSWQGTPPPRFEAFRLDSRAVRPGDLFCAVRGARLDGHEFVAAAAAAGATAAVVERAGDADGLPRLVVSDTHAASAHLASLFAGDPARKLHVVGITGTNGKTTTAVLVRHLLSELGPAAALGTLGVTGPDGSRVEGRLTTPDPVELATRLSELVVAGVRFVGMEVSSHALVQRRVEAVPFSAALFTNLTRDHLDYHADMAEYGGAKLRLLSLLRPDGTAIFNADEPAWKNEPGGPGRLRFGSSPSADVRAADVTLGPAGSAWTLETPEGRAPVSLPLLGRFNVANALGAAAAAHAAGMGPGSIAAALSRAPQVPGRMEVVARSPALVVRDYAHTPDALERALEAVRPVVTGRLLVVFGCGGDRDPGKRPLMGRIGARGADFAIVTSDNPRTEDPEAIVRQIVDGLEPGGWEAVVDRREAIARALRLAGPGDAVLLAGKGHETYQEVDGERRPFDEATIVSELLGKEAEA
jgi:UDP-N-acetylmuramoyl-L-alanyl-D-glutamate--2,6-diaminopimelate ligase